MTHFYSCSPGIQLTGWDEGVATMSLGETAELHIPAALGYGARGAPGGAIPPQSDLTFEVELLAIGTHNSPAFASSASSSSSSAAASVLTATPASALHREKEEEAAAELQDTEEEEERGNDTGCGRWKTNNNQWRCFVCC